MPEEIDRQSIVDGEHLRLLSLGYMIFAGFAGFFACFGLLYVFIGIIMSLAFAHVPATGHADGPLAFVGWLFAGIGFVMFLFAVGVAVARFWVARCVQRRKSRTYCMVIAAIGCLEFPYGTALGVLSRMVLGRESVVKLFNAHQGP
jgi:signal transduction histidine kinase